VRQLEGLAPRLAAFDRLCHDARGPVGIAISGGSDSLALLFIAHEWARARGRKLAALTFDHRLRTAAAGEAARVATICRDLHIPHETLRWDEPVNQQSSARRARHAALALALKAQGGTHLLTGHTANDQAETFLMRARQGSGWYGLAGMQALTMSPVWPEGEGVRIARPVLSEKREDLRTLLHARGQVWIEDPSNENLAYERVRMRRLLAGAPETVERISRCMADLAGLRAIEDRRLGHWLCDHVQVSEADDGIEADLGLLSPDAAVRGLALLIQAVTGRETPPRRENTANLAQRLMTETPFAGATLGGAKLVRKAGRVHLMPEVGRDGPETLVSRRIDGLRRLYAARA
jgi:tRNA(Ile)-lysidine synthase